jgi:hypothetical protein
MAEQESRRTKKRSQARRWMLPGIVMAAVAIGLVAYSHIERDRAANTSPAIPPQVIVSRALVRELDSRLAFLGQFSAVDQVALRAQVGGTLTGIHFKDGDIVHKVISSSRSTRGPTKSSWHRPMPNWRQQARGSRSLIANSVVLRN